MTATDLAQAVRARRHQLGLTQDDVQVLDGPGSACLRSIEGSKKDSYRPTLLRRLDGALGWPVGRSAGLLSGCGLAAARRTPPKRRGSTCCHAGGLA